MGYAELTDRDVVLEVGCGTGNLTAELLKKCMVVGMEKDGKMVEKLRKRFSSEIEEGRFRLLHHDALKVEFPFFTKFVSNIPYKISSPLTFKLFEYEYEMAVVMYQREFAERLVGEDSRLGVISKAYCSSEILEIVRPASFRPKPKVDSAIVRIKPIPAVKVSNKELFEKFVTFAFSMRRKRMDKIAREFDSRFGVRVNLDDEIAKMRPEKVGAKRFAQIVDDIRSC
ncbi:16S rRNA (adenine(1518)-N(6)/adenine(1519)-N(6))-dimethyltransferase RsmA [Archaeoglobus neptunius]|uniref:16S rRNA (adenine(1518)-N(6)/adenine(1519)-N(6))- dimethyltransferase RsmA n=1 Tax=Archaeoglobus neptunius TaxID=2798580 RepID=UPI002EDACB12